MSEDMTRMAEERLVYVPVGDAPLEGNLAIPVEAAGIVLFAHGSGSSRHSPRNRFVARTLLERGLATLLIDLLTAQEEEIDRITRRLRFDIDLLARRLVSIGDWLGAEADTRDLKLGLFGSSTGAAAALVAATQRPSAVHAVVSRGGRPDLAGPALAKVRAPTLLIVGGADYQVLGLNRQALESLPGGKSLEVIPGATHLFEEPGALEQVAQLAAEWFLRYLVAQPAGRPTGNEPQ